jgi:hypothetical protein
VSESKERVNNHLKDIDKSIHNLIYNKKKDLQGRSISQNLGVNPKEAGPVNALAQEIDGQLKQMVPVHQSEVDEFKAGMNENQVMLRQGISQKVKDLSKTDNAAANQLKSDIYRLDRQKNPEKAGKVDRNIEKIKNGEYDYDVVNGLLVKPEGFFESLVTGVKDKNKAYGDYDVYMSGDKGKILDLINRRLKHDPDEAVPVPEEGWIAGPLAEGARMAGGQPLKPLIGAGIAGYFGGPGAAATAGAAISAPEMYKLTFGSVLPHNYNAIKKQNPNAPEDEVLQKAIDLTNQQSTVDAGVGAAMGGLGAMSGFKPTGLNSGLLQKSLGSALKQMGKETVKKSLEGIGVGSVGAAGQWVKNVMSQKAGIPTDENQGVAEQLLGGIGMTMGMTMIAKFPELLKPKTYRELLQSFKNVPKEEVQANLDNLKQSGEITSDQALAAQVAIQEHQALDKSIKADVPESDRLKVQDLIKKRNDLEASLEVEDKAYHAETKEKIKALNEQINSVSKGAERGDLQKLVDAEKKSGNIEGFITDTLVHASENDLKKYFKEISEQVAGGNEESAIATFGANIVNKAKELYPIPERDITVGELIDKDGSYKGQKGSLYVDGQTVVFRVKGGGREYEIGNVNDLKNTPISEVGITHESSVVKMDDNGDINVRGGVYKNNYSDPLMAINRDANGDVVSVNLETPDGKKRTFRGDIAEDIAYNISLKEINKNNESKAAFEDFINTDESTRKAIENGGLREPAKEGSVEDTSQLQPKTTEAKVVKPGEIKHPETITIKPKETGVVGFKTSKGSVYEIDGNKTIRNKAERPEHPGDSGVKEKSLGTVYLTGDEAAKAGVIYTEGVKSRQINKVGNEIHIVDELGNGNKKTTKVKYSNTPEVGLQPFEVFADGGAHLGNKITELIKSKEDAVSVRSAEAIPVDETSGSSQPVGEGVPPSGETSVPQGQPPIEENVPPGKEWQVGDPQMAGITHKQMDAIAEEFGLPTYEKSPEKVSEWDQQAAKKLQDPNALDNLFDKLRKGELPDHVETRMMVRYMGDILAKIDRDPYNRSLQDQLIRTKDLFNIAGRLQGKGLAARKGLTPVEETLGDFIVRDRETNKAPLTDEQITIAKKEYEELKSVKDAISEKLAKDSEARVAKEAERVVAEEAKKAKKQPGKNYKEEQDSIISNIKRKLGGDKKLDSIDYGNNKASKNSVSEAFRKADIVLKKFFPDIEVAAHETESDYRRIEQRPEGSRGVFDPVAKRIAFNMEAIRRSDSGKTIFHEIIHPIINDVIAKNENKLNELYSELYAMKDHPGMDLVWAHEDKYRGRGELSIVKAEALTEFMALVADGQINVDKLSKSAGAKVIELINKILEAIGVEKRLSGPDDLRSLADSIKSALQEEDTSKLGGILKDREGGINQSLDYISHDDASNIAPDVMKLMKNLVEQGIRELPEVTKAIHDVVKGTVEGISEKDIHDIIAGEYKDRKPTRNQLAQQLFDLKKEAKLVNELEQLQSGAVPVKDKKVIERNRRIEELKGQIKDLREEMGLNEKTDDQKLAALKARYKSKIADIEGKISSGDYGPDVKPKPIVLDKEAIELKDKLINLKNERDARLAKMEYEQRNKIQKATDAISDSLDVVRTAQTNPDLSFFGRQGIKYLLTHPVKGTQLFWESFRQAGSQKRYDRWLHDMHNSDRWKLMEDSGLAVLDPNSLNTERLEEQWKSKLIHKIPVAGQVAKWSERAFTSAANMARADWFLEGVKILEGKGKTFENSPEEYKGWASAVNNMTGRGGLGKLEPVANQLAIPFWSPRLIASNMNLYLNPAYYVKMPKTARMMLAKNMAQATITGIGFLLAAKRLGADVEFDPRSSDFGKIKVGNTRFDVWGGAAQYVRVFAQLFTETRKSGGKVSDINGRGLVNTGANVIRTKFSPILGFAVDAKLGTNVVGEEVKWKDAYKLMIPMLYNDIDDVLKDKDGGADKAAVAGLLSFLGIGAQTYGSSGGSSSNSSAQKNAHKTTKTKHTKTSR